MFMGATFWTHLARGPQVPHPWFAVFHSAVKNNYFRHNASSTWKNNIFSKAQLCY